MKMLDNLQVEIRMHVTWEAFYYHQEAFKNHPGGHIKTKCPPSFQKWLFHLDQDYDWNEAGVLSTAAISYHILHTLHSSFRQEIEIWVIE